jgi:ABC-2 type transport system ATP-binding protein
MSAAIPPPLPEPIVSVRNLHRTFAQVQAVRGVSFEIYPGQVVGFIGANGAGKTTTMRMIATLDAPTLGSISVCGFDTVNFPGEVRRRIGWMPDAYGAYENMTVAEYLDFFGRSFGYRGEERLRRIAEVMEFTDLLPLADRPMSALSKGMGQRLCLGRTLLNDPEVLILDEPAAGLDPKARVEFKRLVRLLAVDGKTVFISSHILSELAEMCDTLLFIDAGRIVHHGSAESLQHHSAHLVVEVQVVGEVEPLLSWVSLNPGIELMEARKHGARLSLDAAEPEIIARTLRKMITDGLPVVDFHREGRRLEEAFVDMLSRHAGAEPVFSAADRESGT